MKNLFDNFHGILVTRAGITLFSIALALNLVNFYWIDTVFILATLLGVIKQFTDPETSFRSNFGLSKSHFIYFFTLYFLSGLVGYIQHSPMQQREWVEISSMRWIWGFFAFYYLGLRSKNTLKSIQSFFVPLSAVLLYILYQHLKQTSGSLFTPELRLQGLYENPNHLALALTVVWGFIAGFIFINANTKRRPLLPLVALAITTIVLVGTYSRTSWLGIIAVTVVALMYSKSKKGLLSAVAILAVAAIFVYYNSFGLKDRILYSFNLSQTADQFTRFTVWKVAWQIFIDHPLFGVGFEHNVRLYPEYYAKMGYASEYMVGHAHNQFLEVMSGSGILGLTGYLGVFVSGFIFFHRRFIETKDTCKKQFALGAILAIVGLFASSITDAPFRLHEVRNYVLMLLGFAAGFLNTSTTTLSNEND